MDTPITCQTVSLADLRRRRLTPLRWSPRWKNFMGDTPAGYRMAVYGLWGSGKSTFVWAHAGEVRRFGPVLIGSDEESIHAGMMGSRARLLRLSGDGIDVTNDLTPFSEFERRIDKGGYRFVIIDSFNYLIEHPDVTIDTIIGLRHRHPGLSFILIYHATSDNRVPKGPKKVIYDCDIVVKVTNMVAHTEKNRYGRTPKLLPVLRR